MRDSIVTVFGGTGFVGRHVIRRLAAEGATIRVPTRTPERAVHLKPMGDIGQIVIERFDTGRDGAVEAMVDGASHVVSLVGILFERRRGDFEAAQAKLPGRIAAASAGHGISRMVHVSAIGADPASPSQYARTKAEGEAAVLAALPTATILRPSIIFGPEDSFFNRFAEMARFSPALPLIGGGRTRFQPVYVGDVADAVMAGLLAPDTAGRTYELGGPRVCTFRELLAYMLGVIQRRRWLIDLPWGVARLQASLAELLPEPPLTRDQIELLKRDNVVSPGAPGLPELGIVPTPMEMVVPGYLHRYIPGAGLLPAA
jgi:NADH dehydrogenase